MAFESSAFLWALPIALVPLIMHFYMRSKAPSVQFDAMMFLVLEGGSTATIRWTQAIMLAVRTLLIAVIIIIFARPYVVRQAVVGAQGPVSLVVVLDDSLSMRLGSAGFTPWDHATAKAMDMLSELNPESEVVVVASGYPVRSWPPVGEVWTPQKARRHILKMTATMARGDLGQATKIGLERVRLLGPRQRRVFIASDFRSSDLVGMPEPEEFHGVTVNSFDALFHIVPENRAIISAVAVPDRTVSTNRVKVAVELLNGSLEPFDDVLTVRIGLASIARRVECPPGQVCAYEFVMEANERFGEVRIPSDELPEDDVRWFSARSRNSVLIVNGAPRRQAEEDEEFFIRKALQLKIADSPVYTLSRVYPDDMSPVHLAAADIVILANVGGFRPAQIQALADFVARGGGVLISAGDNFDKITDESWNALLPSLPVERLFVSSPRYIISGQDLEQSSSLNMLQEIGRLLDDVDISWLSFLGVGWPQGSSVLIQTDASLPLLVERRIGSGAVLLWLSTLDRDWTDFPLRPAYAPFVRWAVSHLQSFMAALGRSSITVNDARRVSLTTTRADVVTPGGEIITFKSSGEFTQTSVPGVYLINYYEGSGAEPTGSDVFLVNTDSSESFLARPNEIPFADTEEVAPVDPLPEKKVPWHPWLLGVALLLFVAEAWLRGRV